MTRTERLIRLVEIKDNFSNAALNFLSLCNTNDSSQPIVNAYITILNAMQNKIDELKQKITVETYYNERFFDGRLN